MEGPLVSDTTEVLSGAAPAPEEPPIGHPAADPAGAAPRSSSRSGGGDLVQAACLRSAADRPGTWYLRDRADAEGGPRSRDPGADWWRSLYRTQCNSISHAGHVCGSRRASPPESGRYGSRHIRPVWHRRSRARCWHRHWGHGIGDAPVSAGQPGAAEPSAPPPSSRRSPSRPSRPRPPLSRTPERQRTAVEATAEARHEPAGPGRAAGTATATAAATTRAAAGATSAASAATAARTASPPPRATAAAARTPERPGRQPARQPRGQPAGQPA